MNNDINDNKEIKTDLIEGVCQEPNADEVINNTEPNATVSNSVANKDMNDSADNANPSTNTNSSSTPTKSRKPLGILLMIVLIGAAIAVLCVVLFLPQKADANVLKLAELQVREIESITKYNIDNSTNYKSLSLDMPNEKMAKAYSGESGDILLEERITIAESNESIIFYALNKSSRVDILDAFFTDNYSRMKINEINVTFKIANSDGLYTARFACIIDDNAYYVESISTVSGRWTELAKQLTK